MAQKLLRRNIPEAAIYFFFRCIGVVFKDAGSNWAKAELNVVFSAY